jgi:hypothetical protein
VAGGDEEGGADRAADGERQREARQRGQRQERLVQLVAERLGQNGSESRPPDHRVDPVALIGVFLGGGEQVPETGGADQFAVARVGAQRCAFGESAASASLPRPAPFLDLRRQWIALEQADDRGHMEEEGDQRDPRDPGEAQPGLGHRPQPVPLRDGRSPAVGQRVGAAEQKSPAEGREPTTQQEPAIQQAPEAVDEGAEHITPGRRQEGGKRSSPCRRADSGHGDRWSTPRCATAGRRARRAPPGSGRSARWPG